MLVSCATNMLVSLCAIFSTILSLIRGESYKSKSALHNVVFTNMQKVVADDVHSEYFFGRCTTKNQELVAKTTKLHDELGSRMVIRGWLQVDAPPRCIYVRARSHFGDQYRYHAYKFNFCICTIVYNYSNNNTVFYYYEWYIPVEMKPHVKWDLFFYK